MERVEREKVERGIWERELNEIDGRIEKGRGEGEGVSDLKMKPSPKAKCSFARISSFETNKLEAGHVISHDCRLFLIYSIDMTSFSGFRLLQRRV